MGFFTGSCKARWSRVTRCSVDSYSARVLDISVLGPLLTVLGVCSKKVPLVRVGLVSLGAAIIAWNSYNLVVDDVDKNVPVHEIDLDAVRAAGL